jgi:hypothetical protein
MKIAIAVLCTVLITPAFAQSPSIAGTYTGSTSSNAGAPLSAKLELNSPADDGKVTGRFWLYARLGSEGPCVVEGTMEGKNLALTVRGSSECTERPLILSVERPNRLTGTVLSNRQGNQPVQFSK